MELIIFVLLDAIITGFMVWLAGKVTAVDIRFKEATLCVGISSLFGFIPAFGWPLSIIAYFYLLKKFTAADIWPDLILLVLVSKLFSMVAIITLGGL